MQLAIEGQVSTCTSLAVGQNEVFQNGNGDPSAACYRFEHGFGFATGGSLQTFCDHQTTPGQRNCGTYILINFYKVENENDVSVSNIGSCFKYFEGSTTDMLCVDYKSVETSPDRPCNVRLNGVNCLSCSGGCEENIFAANFGPHVQSAIGDCTNQPDGDIIDFCTCSDFTPEWAYIAARASDTTARTADDVPSVPNMEGILLEAAQYGTDTGTFVPLYSGDHQCIEKNITDLEPISGGSTSTTIKTTYAFCMLLSFSTILLMTTF